MKFDVIGTSVRPFKDMWTPALRKKFLQWSTAHEHVIRRLPLLSPLSAASPRSHQSRTTSASGAGTGQASSGSDLSPRQAAMVRPATSRRGVSARGSVMHAEWQL